MVYRFSNIRTELGFGTMPEESLDYSRKGGCFVSLCKGVCISFSIFLVVVLLLLIVFFSTRNAYETQTGITLEEFVIKPSPFIEKTDRILKLFNAKAYRLIIHPYLNDDNDMDDIFYFKGVVWITVVARRGDNRKIEINVKNLDIVEDDVMVYRSFKIPNLRNLSQTYLENTNYFNLHKYRVKRNENSEIIDNDTQNSGEIVTDATSPATISEDTSTAGDEVTTTLMTDVDTATTTPQAEETTPYSTTDTSIPSVWTTTMPQVNHNKFHHDNDDYDVDDDDSDDGLQIKKINQVELDEVNDSIIISLDLELKRNIYYTIRVPFSGNTTNHEGFFYKRFEQPNNISKFLAGTFTSTESTHMIIPCFDDDDFQSTFETSIIRSMDYKSASNARLRSTDIVDDNLVMDNYFPTPPMPPSELGFIVTNIKSYPRQINDNLSLELFTQEENSTKIKNTMSAIQDVVNIIENYTRVPFNMDKLNYVIMPHRQNYREIKRGIIITSEYYIPISTDAYSSNQEITNELALQWFDGINQYELDEEIWLKKAFPLFLQQIALDENDESDYYEAEYFTFKSKVMKDDMDYSQFKLTREIDEDRLDKDTMNFMQKKGLCLLKMFNYTLSSTVFKQSVSEYFLKRTTNQTIDFYSTLHEATLRQNNTNHVDLPQVFDQWIDYDQIPLINVKQLNGNFYLTQAIVKFESTAMDLKVRTIPVTYHDFGSNIDNLVWIKMKQFFVHNCENTSYILLNPSGTGYYRANYEYNTWRQIIANLATNEYGFTAMMKAVLIDDAYNLARYGIIGYELVFDMIKSITGYDTSMLPWKIVFGNFDYIYRNMQSMPNFYYVVKYFESVINQINKNINQTVTENSSLNNELDNLRILLERWSCKLGFSDCVISAKIQFKRLIESETTKNISESEDQLYMIFCTTIKYGGWSEWHKIESNLNISDYITSVFIRSLGCTREPLLMAKYINYLLCQDETEFSTIKRQHTMEVIQSISENQVMIKYAMEYFLETWNEIIKIYKLSDLAVIFKRISTEKELQILQSIFSKYSDTFVDHDKLIFKHILHSIQTTLKWKAEIAIKINKDTLKL